MDEENRQKQLDRTHNKLAKQDEAAITIQYKTLEQALASGERKSKAIEDKIREEAKANEHVIPDFSDTDALRFDFDMHRLANHIGLTDRELEANSDKLKYLMNWAKEKSGSSKIIDVLTTLKQVKSSLGFNEVGKTALNRLYQYARLQEDSERLRKEMALLKE